MRKLKGWRLFVYSMSAFGPNLLMTLVTGYLNDALLAPAGLDPAKTFTGALLVSVGLCSVLFFVAKEIDAFVDVPLAYLTDRLPCRWGRRKVSILIGWVPMVISFLLLWNPQWYMGGGATAVTWIEAVLLTVFYSSYTLTTVAYFGTYSAITENEKDLARLSQFKAFFDTIQYCVAYALFPALLINLLGGMEAGAISRTMNLLAPLMLTMLIPLVMIRGEENEEHIDKRIPFKESVRISASSKPFRRWLITQMLLHMGLMLFLSGIGTTIPDNLIGISGWQVTVMNSAAFAPVPIMLLIYNHFKRKRGSRFALQTALVVFGVSMFIFALSWRELWHAQPMVGWMLGMTASVVGSYGVGVFFSVCYYYPAQIAAQERRVCGKDHAAMYFAIQGLVTQMASAIGVNLIYINLIGREISVAGLPGGQFMLVPLISGILMLCACGASFGMERNGFDG